MISHKIVEGMSTIYKKEATITDTLPAPGSMGILDVLVSTPAILTMIIEASSSLLDPLLPEDYVTVGKNIELSHERPTMINNAVSIAIKVKKIDGDRVYLEFTGHDPVGQICSGKYERVIVNKQLLIDNVYKRAQTIV